ncbi:MAG: DNA-binding protein [Candidatus Fluviicola riflensis]|nr:MAG: DNA-binding protein [Candidatus Fluviicola riflensis]OGS76737.1 MAG: DNA-binding protein [Candidatus Fluviicola riflensis]OGS82908.1 MAG: DNA-binding protein [Fluviicola sp. RIFCSPHIGHO2_01_FULL_43_53]OGS88467.1 MAG: DNA-binding protein [Fluviicola sp. RIFCSPHIGHO2_12_FULL_43_24]
MGKTNIITVNGSQILISNFKEEDYICLTDMVRANDGDDSRPNIIVQNWMRNRNTVEFLGVWESLNNPAFKGIEFDALRKEAGLNSFVLTPKKWTELTDAIGVISKQGKQGGIYAHKDIAFEFGSWLSPIFKLYIIKEYQRLKEIENNQYGLEWNVKRMVSKANYHIHTQAVKDYIIPRAGYSQAKEWLAYADEADLLNIVVFGCTAKAWRESNPVRSLRGENIRDMASINDLTILSNMESLNSILITNGIDRKERFKILHQTVKSQKSVLDGLDSNRAIPKLSDTTYIDAIAIQHLEPPKPKPKVSDLNTPNLSINKEIAKETEKRKDLSDFNQNLVKAIKNEKGTK